MEKVTIVGSSGQLGSELSVQLQRHGYKVIEADHDIIDVADFNSCRKMLLECSPNVIINASAYHQLERCEENPETAFAVNALGPRNLSKIANEVGSVLVHISSDYVFDGKKQSPYKESDTPCPINVYGNSKVSGEQFVQTIAEKYFIFRVCGLYGINPCRDKGGDNFVKLMIKLSKTRDKIRVVDNEFVTPTNVEDVVQQIIAMISTDRYGLYHSTCEGSCSWYEFAKEIFRLTGIKIDLQIASPNEFPSKTPRPLYSVLENSNLKKLDLNIMPHWKSSLEKYIPHLVS